MKKIFLCLAVCTLALNSCEDDNYYNNNQETLPKVSIETRNSYDDQAITKYLNDYYLDDKGNLKAFSDTDDSDDKYTKLADLPHETLPSGVVYVVRPNAQPEPDAGTTIGDKDIIRLMGISTTYVATKTDGVVSFESAYSFRNTISGTGTPEEDPAYYYVKNSVLKAANEKNGTSYDHSYYEIEGFREALQHFKAFDMDDSENYNLQGVIIVPSRAAFARDPHYNYIGISLNDRSFVFNFQVYKTSARPDNLD